MGIRFMDADFTAEILTGISIAAVSMAGILKAADSMDVAFMDAVPRASTVKVASMVEADMGAGSAVDGAKHSSIRS